MSIHRALRAARPPSPRRAHGRRTIATAAVVAALGSVACEDDAPTAPALREPIALPEDLAAVAFTAEGRPTSPYVLLEIRQPDGFRGFVAVNAAGEPVWFFRTLGSPSGATRRANGNFVFLDHERGLVEVTVDGEVVRELAQQPRPGRFIHHDVTATPRNTLLFIAEDTRPWGDSTLTGDAIWEWDPESGAVVRRWSAFDHLDPEVDWGPRSGASDWLHANALNVGASGHVLLSLHFLDQVVAISPDFGAVEWRLGGVGATIPVDDPFSGQHTAAEIAPGRVLLFDNGFAREGARFSRAVEYKLRGDSAHKVWEWRPERDNWARVISSARRLPNGNTLIAFGTAADPGLGTTGPIEVYEVTPDGEPVWHLELGGRISSMYRATPLFDL
ncbi:MAG TPA: aryl-sulfate sulfotransferase [Longimicrobiales bacterium]